MKRNIAKKLSAVSLVAVLSVGTVIGFADNKEIGVSKAKSIALKDAGVQSKNAGFIKAKLDSDDGYTVYDIEFYSNGIEYDYEIDAYSGDILEKDKDIENFTIPKKQLKNNTKKQTKNTNIGTQKAKEIALKDAGLNAKDVWFEKAKLDYDDGRKIYDVEFSYDYTEYDYEIDAKTGVIVEKNVDSDYDD